jgi:hypothetical protein
MTRRGTPACLVGAVEEHRTGVKTYKMKSRPNPEAQVVKLRKSDVNESDVISWDASPVHAIGPSKSSSSSGIPRKFLATSRLNGSTFVRVLNLRCLANWQ